MSTMALYLYGDRNLEIEALVRDDRFRRLVRELFAAGEAAVPSEPPTAWTQAVRHGLFTAEDGVYRAGPRLVAIPAAAEQDLPDLLRPTFAPYVEIAGDAAAELRAAFAQTAAGERFEWRQVEHAVVAGMFLDLAMGLEVYRSGEVLRPPMGDSVVWAFETVSAENAYGVQWTPAVAGRAFFAELWHRKVKRAKSRLAAPVVEQLARVARGEAVDKSAKELLYLRHLKLVRTVDSALQVQVPCFGPTDAGRLLEPLTAWGRCLVADAIVPALETLLHHAWWRDRAQQDGYRHAAVRLVLEYGVDRVIGSRVLAPFPDTADLAAEWGRWLWQEPETPLTLVPSLAAREHPAAAS